MAYNSMSLKKSDLSPEIEYRCNYTSSRFKNERNIKFARKAFLKDAEAAFTGQDEFRGMDIVRRIKDKKTGETLGAIFRNPNAQIPELNTGKKFLNKLKFFLRI